MDRLRRASLRVFATLLLLTLTGCIFGGGRSYLQFDQGQLYARVEADVTINPCTLAPIPGQVHVNCSDGGDGGTGLGSVDGSADLHAGMFTGNFLDPIILQMPASTTDFAATYANSAGSGNLTITQAGTSIAADVNNTIVAEPGMKLVILDFPGGALPAGDDHFHFGFNFTVNGATNAPLPLKFLLTGKINANGRTFYPPMFPCVLNMASVPAVSIPTANAFIALNLTPLVGQEACHNVSYNFDAGPAPTVAVVEFFHQGLGHYFVTWHLDEIALLDAGTQFAGWTRTGYGFKAYAQAQVGTSTVCRFYIPPALGDSHYYGRNAKECNDTAAANPGMILEDSLFMHLYLPATGVCPTNTVPLYRAWNHRPDTNHRYTTERAVRDQMAADGWVLEGEGSDYVVMCAPA